jgi:nitrogen regulatory protein PII
MKEIKAYIKRHNRPSWYGKIYVSNVETAVCISTAERGEVAV